MSAINLEQLATGLVPATAEKIERIKNKKIWLLKNLSYSMNLLLHRCPKRWQITVLGGNVREDEETPGNIHFAFGHAVAAAIQCYFAGGTKRDAYFAALSQWSLPITDINEKKKKGFWYVLRAADIAEHFVREIKAEGWEVAVFNGQAAVEYSYLIHLPDDFRFAAHIDLILYHRERDKYRICEIKTSGYSNVPESVFANSSQALSYSVVLDHLVGAAKSAYDVLYMVYKCPSMEFELLPFTKSNLVKVEWIRDILYDMETVKKLIETNYFPKRGEACNDFFSVCEFFGGCGYSDPYLGVENEATLDALIAKQEQNTKIDRHNKRGYDFEINLVDLIKSRQLVLTED